MELKYKSFSLAILLVCIGHFSFAYDSLRLESNRGWQVVVHQVEQGETLYSLSRRYSADVKQIVEFNEIVNNSLALGQLILIPIAKEKGAKGKSETQSPKSASSVEHVVQMKETLYSISRLYGMKVDEIKALNGMKTNELSVGQVIKVSANSKSDLPESKPDVKPKEKSVVNGFTEYLVQSGDILETIARKFNVRPDSIIIWNELSDSYLAIGQRILIKGEIDKEAQKIAQKVETTGYSKISRITDQSGFSKVFEEGIAKKIEEAGDSDKYLAMHRTLKVGSMVEVRNLMNNKKIFVRIVGKLPSTGINDNTLIRLTPICFERLGIIDPTSRVEISYYED
jgi:LysM repeat protein